MEAKQYLTRPPFQTETGSPAVPAGDAAHALLTMKICQERAHRLYAIGELHSAAELYTLCAMAHRATELAASQGSHQMSQLEV